MAFDPTKISRRLMFASLLALGAASAVGCAAESESEKAASDDGTNVSVDDITHVNQTKVKRQSIGNCWIYATASWFESLEQSATGDEMNSSESWLTYWHWFDQLRTAGRYGGSPMEIQTGGTYGVAADLLDRYGIVLEKDFIASEAESEMSNRQSSALAAINASLKSGALMDPAVLKDSAKLRAELDKAWGLEPSVVARIDAVFGKDVSKTLDRAYVNTPPGNGILRPVDVPALLRNPATKATMKGTLQDALGRRVNSWTRSGQYAFQEETYPYDSTQRRAFWKRVQAALHDQVPVITSWAVDFNALSSSSRFSLAELERRGPGRQGGHMTVMHDYQAEVPGIGLLEAGKQATPEQMRAALAEGTKIEFVRVKNSWGGIRPDRWSEAAIPGYHDLELAYLNGPIKKCAEKDGKTDTTNCTSQQIPLWDVVLPAGY